MARPGLVLEIDERTPPLVVPDGDGFRLERFPLGTRVVYPADALPLVRFRAQAMQQAVPDVVFTTKLLAMGKPSVGRNTTRSK